jgi:5'-methylthioadenosine phosphorylase
MTRAILGIIGGSGLYDLPGLHDVQEEAVETPWGAPSDKLVRGRIGQTDIVFLPRHGRGHRLSPSGINYRANIDAMKRLGVTDLVSLSACGSYREDLPPGSFVLVDQFMDRTVKRETSFFGVGLVAHVSFAHPVSPNLLDRLAHAAAAEDIAVQRGGTYVCMEGPQFSTLAESLAYKALGASVIGMTAMPEAKLAREAELPYATLAMVTDYDAWHPSESAVDVEMVLRTVHDNAARAQRLIARLAADFPTEHVPCPIGSDRALDSAIITARPFWDDERLRRLDAIMGRVLAA